MTSKKTLNSKGFTLVELIIVLAILGILAAIAVPVCFAYLDKARLAADNANLGVLNSATNLYRITKISTDEDIFNGIATDEGRMQELVTNGFLKETVTPKQNNVAFVWNIPNQKWIIRATSPTTITPTPIPTPITPTPTSTPITPTPIPTPITPTPTSTPITPTPTSTPITPTPSVIAVQSVSLDKTAMILAATTGQGMNDGPKTLVATVLPANATNKAVTWSSSNTGAATVDANGVVRFVNPGTAVITVTTVDGGKTATCTVRTQW